MTRPTLRSFRHKGQDLNARTDYPAELDVSFLNEDGIKRNLLKMYWEFQWVRKWWEVDEAGHGGPVTSFINKWVIFCRHAPFTYVKFETYGLALVLLIAGLVKYFT